MQYERSSKSQKITLKVAKQQQNKQQTKQENKNLVTISLNRNKANSPSSNKIKNQPPFHKKQQDKVKHQSKSLIFQQIRLKVQEKLLYVKQCRLKNIKKEEIFHQYPFSNMQAFIFNDEALRDNDGILKAKIIEDENGIHLCQYYSQKLPPTSKYVTIGQQIQKQSFNGLSVSIFHNGDIFEGTYHDGKYCGKGLQLNANGNVYIGCFKDHLKQGQGNFYQFGNNQMYSGYWHGGLPHGFGIYIGKDRYQGNFSNGLKHGFGQQQFSNGDLFVGEYINSVSQGYGEYYWADGSFYKGDFRQGVRHGFGIWQDQKQKYEGNYRLDQKEGLGIYLWKDQKIYKGQFRDDFRQGYGQLYNISKQQFKEIAVYKGCWSKGKTDEDSKFDDKKIKQLYLFLDEKGKLQQLINSKESNMNTVKKKRIGHKNCIPSQKHHQFNAMKHKVIK